MAARIFSPARSQMQSGRGKSKNWVLEFEPETRRPADPLMGWTSTSETLQQVRLQFDTAEQAIAYAEKHGIAYELAAQPKARQVIKSYSDNFKYGRKELWTH
jgi:hypothetical protein